jgi:hypothetical protein
MRRRKEAVADEPAEMDEGKVGKTSGPPVT